MTRTIQVTIGEDLLRRVELATRELGIARSALVRQALEMALRELAISKLERRHAAGYRRFPVIRGEFDTWESEQAWGEPGSGVKSGGMSLRRPISAGRCSS